jgi:hypothetical protein
VTPTRVGHEGVPLICRRCKWESRVPAAAQVGGAAASRRAQICDFRATARPGRSGPVHALLQCCTAAVVHCRCCKHRGRARVSACRSVCLCVRARLPQCRSCVLCIRVLWDAPILSFRSSNATLSSTTSSSLKTSLPVPPKRHTHESIHTHTHALTHAHTCTHNNHA